MKTLAIKNKTTLMVNESLEGETLEEKIMRIVENNEPITDGAPIVYTDRRDGVLPAYNIRTDRWDVAIDAMDKISATKIAKRDEYLKTKEKTDTNVETSGETPANTSDTVN